VFAAVALLLLIVVLARAPDYLPAVLVILAPLLLALLWKPRPGLISAHGAAAKGLVVATLFIVSMLALHQVTERRVLHQVEKLDSAPVDGLMVGPVPANPTVWEFVVEQEGRLRHGYLTWLGDRSLTFAEFDRRAGRSHDLWPEIEDSGQSSGFLSWARFPWLEIDSSAAGGRVHVMDARYARRRTSGFGGTVVTLPKAPSLDSTLQP